jgi:hypothetical protein
MDNFFSSPALFGDLHTKTAAGLLDQIERGAKEFWTSSEIEEG